jgi:hypothetical protein
MALVRLFCVVCGRQESERSTASRALSTGRWDRTLAGLPHPRKRALRKANERTTTHTDVLSVCLFVLFVFLFVRGAATAARGGRSCAAAALLRLRPMRQTTHSAWPAATRCRACRRTSTRSDSAGAPVRPLAHPTAGTGHTTPARTQTHARTHARKHTRARARARERERAHTRLGFDGLYAALRRRSSRLRRSTFGKSSIRGRAFCAVRTAQPKIGAVILRMRTLIRQMRTLIAKHVHRHPYPRVCGAAVSTAASRPVQCPDDSPDRANPASAEQSCKSRFRRAIVHIPRPPRNHANPSSSESAPCPSRRESRRRCGRVGHGRELVGRDGHCRFACCCFVLGTLAAIHIR